MPETILTGNLPDRGSLVLRAFGGGSAVDAPAAAHAPGTLGYQWTVPAAVADGDAYKILRGDSEPYTGEIGDGTVEVLTPASPDPSPGEYDPPGHLPVAGDVARTFVAQDGYTAAVGRRLLYDVATADRPAGVTAAGCTLEARQRVVSGQTPHRIELACALAELLPGGVLRLHFDLPGSTALLADPRFRTGYYDAAVVAVVEGERVTLRTETWAVSPTPKA